MQHLKLSKQWKLERETPGVCRNQLQNFLTQCTLLRRDQIHRLKCQCTRRLAIDAVESTQLYLVNTRIVSAIFAKRRAIWLKYANPKPSLSNNTGNLLCRGRLTTHIKLRMRHKVKYLQLPNIPCLTPLVGTQNPTL